MKVRITFDITQKVMDEEVLQQQTGRELKKSIKDYLEAAMYIHKKIKNLKLEVSE